MKRMTRGKTVDIEITILGPLSSPAPLSKCLPPPDLDHLLICSHDDDATC